MVTGQIGPRGRQLRSATMSSLPPPPPGAPPPPPPGPPGPPPNIPPGYTPYQQHGLVAGRGEQVVGLAKAIQVLVAIVLVTNVVTLVLLLASRSQFSDFLNDLADEDDVRSTINTLVAVGTLAGAVQLAAAICTMIWMWRLARNVQLAGRPHQTWAPGWAIGGWFCPPCVFVIPWLMLMELWKGSDPSTAPGDPAWKSKPGWPLITVWWVLFGLSGIILAGMQLSSTGSMSQDVEDAADFYDSTIGWTVLSSIATIAAGICFILIVRRMTERQRLLTGQ